MSGLKFFADRCVSNYIIWTLRDTGCEVFRLRNHIPPDSPDMHVMAKAQEFGAILLSERGLCRHSHISSVGLQRHHSSSGGKPPRNYSADDEKTEDVSVGSS